MEEEVEKEKWFSYVPDEIWSQILEAGVKSGRVSSRDLCSISITCRRLHRLSNLPHLWSSLLALHFPPSPPIIIDNSNYQNHIDNNNNHSKALYKSRYEKDRAWKALAHRRAVLNVESQIAICRKNLRDLRSQLCRESDRVKETASELANLNKIRQASVALNVWQPAIVRGRQKQLVEQCEVPVEQRISTLEMELKLSKNQIETLNKRYNNERRKLDASKERLASLLYHPTCNHQVGVVKHDSRRKKKLKQSNDNDGKPHENGQREE